MELQEYKSYRLTPTLHKIEVLAFSNLRPFFYMSCKICKLQNKCNQHKHKSEICKISKKIEDVFADFTYARVASFVSDEFYTGSKPKHIKIIKETTKFLRMKYIIDDENVRN